MFSLYLKIKNDECAEYKKCLNLCEIFNFGTCTVNIFIESTGKILKTNLSVNINDTMLMLLKRYIGENNVVLKKR